jgi:hypothetical protein
MKNLQQEESEDPDLEISKEESGELFDNYNVDNFDDLEDILLK